MCMEKYPRTFMIHVFKASILRLHVFILFHTFVKLEYGYSTYRMYMERREASTGREEKRDQSGKYKKYSFRLFISNIKEKLYGTLCIIYFYTTPCTVPGTVVRTCTNITKTKNCSQTTLLQKTNI